MNEFTKEKIEELARDNPIVGNWLMAYHMSYLTYEKALRGMIVQLVEHNDALLALLKEKTENQIPLVILHSPSASLSKIQLSKVHELIRDNKVSFEPAYTTTPDGSIELKHISINPRFKSCSDNES